MNLSKIYTELRELQVCESAYDFSTKFLGKHRSYYSVLQARNRQPSASALLSLYFALQGEISAKNRLKLGTQDGTQDQLTAIAGEAFEELKNRSNSNS